MTKWRLSAWLDEKPDVIVRKQWTHSCKLCAIARAMTLAETVRIAHGVLPADVHWLVEYLDGGLQGWNVRYSDRSRVGDWVKRHGH